jgi:hypothetical protein
MKAQYLPDARAEHQHSIDLAEIERAMVELGQGTRALAHHQGHDSWFASVKTWSMFWQLKVAMARFAMATRQSQQARARWWKARLDAAFAAGYRKGSQH